MKLTSIFEFGFLAACLDFLTFRFGGPMKIASLLQSISADWACAVCALQRLLILLCLSFGLSASFG